MTQGSLRTRSVERIRGIVAPMLAARGASLPVDPSDDLREAGLTSLDMVNLMLAVEGAFDIFIPEDKIAPHTFRSIEAIEALVSSLT